MSCRLIFTTIFASVSFMVVSSWAKKTVAPSVPQTPIQIVRHIRDELDRNVAHRERELAKDKAKMILLVDEILLPYFDVDYASILVLGRHARTATAQQRARFAKAFYSSLIHRYAEGLLNYTQGSVNVLPFRGSLDNRVVLVRSQVTMSSGKHVSVNYTFHKTRGGKWKAYDVIIEGISYIINYRNQVGAEIRKIGLDQLISNLRHREMTMSRRIQHKGQPRNQKNSGHPHHEK